MLLLGEGFSLTLIKETKKVRYKTFL